MEINQNFKLREMPIPKPQSHRYRSRYRDMVEAFLAQNIKSARLEVDNPYACYQALMYIIKTYYSDKVKAHYINSSVWLERL